MFHVRVSLRMNVTGRVSVLVRRAVSRALQQFAPAWRAYSAALMPVRTGRLRASVRVTLDDGGLTLSVSPIFIVIGRGRRESIKSQAIQWAQQELPRYVRAELARGGIA